MAARFDDNHAMVLHRDIPHIDEEPPARKKKRQAWLAKKKKREAEATAGDK